MTTVRIAGSEAACGPPRWPLHPFVSLSPVGGAPAEGPNDETQRIVTKRDGNASDHPSNRDAATPQDEPGDSSPA